MSAGGACRIFVYTAVVHRLRLFLRKALCPRRCCIPSARCPFPTGEAFICSFRVFKTTRTLLSPTANSPGHLRESLGGLLADVLIILAFSLFVALILKSKFRGRTAVRAIFFLPVIIASGVVLDLLNNNDMASLLLSGDRNSILFDSGGMNDWLIPMGLGPLIEVVQNIFDMSWKSGIQILLFLAGLQTISPQMYEVANVEGATAWEKFWKITFPLLTPILLLNVVYTIIDSFTDFSNQTMRIIMDYAQHMRIGYGSALAIIYL